MLASGLSELNPEACEVLLLRAWAQLTEAEIAIALSLPVGTVKMVMGFFGAVLFWSRSRTFRSRTESFRAAART